MHSTCSGFACFLYIFLCQTLLHLNLIGITVWCIAFWLPEHFMYPKPLGWALLHILSGCVCVLKVVFWVGETVTVWKSSQSTTMWRLFLHCVWWYYLYDLWQNSHISSDQDSWPSLSLFCDDNSLYGWFSKLCQGAFLNQLHVLVVIQFIYYFICTIFNCASSSDCIASSERIISE